MYRNTESLCCVRGTKIVLKVNDTSKTDKLIGKKGQICDYQRQGVRGGRTGRRKSKDTIIQL